MDHDGNTVVAHLEAALEAARESAMSASELMGLLFFYAHNVAQSARETVVADEREEPATT